MRAVFHHLSVPEHRHIGAELGGTQTVADVYCGLSADAQERAMALIDKSLHKPLSVAALADKVGIDRSYLCSVFKRELGCSPQQYILNRKMDKAKYFLSSTAENVKYIALSLGYDDPFVFSRAFKKVTGMSPSAWRQSGKKK